MSRLSDTDFLNFFKYYNAEVHQEQGAKLLYDELLASEPTLLNEKQEWIRAYRNQKASVPTKSPDPVEMYPNPLDVPYEYQNDNKSGEGYRECFSSSCAMVARYYGKVSGDDEYNKIRAKYGDSTDANAQIRALKSLGLEAVFYTNRTFANLKNQIDIGRPTPCGWLHKGPSSNPSGGGHYSVVIGYTTDGKYWIHHDPNGEANLSGGGYVSTAPSAGKSQKYSRSNWDPRWCVSGDGDGWYMDIWDPAKE